MCNNGFFGGGNCCWLIILLIILLLRRQQLRQQLRYYLRLQLQLQPLQLQSLQPLQSHPLLLKAHNRGGAPYGGAAFAVKKPKGLLTSGSAGDTIYLQDTIFPHNI